MNTSGAALPPGQPPITDLTPSASSDTPNTDSWNDVLVDMLERRSIDSIPSDEVARVLSEMLQTITELEYALCDLRDLSSTPPANQSRSS